MIEHLRENLLEKVQKEVDRLGVGGLKGKVSDGYHTFDELYEHRVELFIALCRVVHGGNESWRSKLHSDGSEFPGWFVLGMGVIKGQQITYHLPMYKWDECDFAETLYRAPEWDGHTSQDVLQRLKTTT